MAGAKQGPTSLGITDTQGARLYRSSNKEPLEFRTLHNLHTMKSSILSCGLLACLAPIVSATALTYKLAANERACFYSNIEHQGAKIAFYYAVRPFHNTV